MKVLYLVRASLFKNSGGDTIQILKTTEHLRKLGVETDIKLTSEKIDYSGYDLLHFFNLIRPADILRHAERCSLPYVVSPVFVEYMESDLQTRMGLAKLLLRFFSENRIEYFKAIARLVLNGEKITSPAFLFYGQGRSVRRIIRKARMLLPNSANEYQRLQRRFGTECPYRVIPNAIDPTLFRPMTNPPARENDLVLCAGRIEGIKNQLNLIRAVNGSPFRLILAGAPAANQRGYYEECRRAAGPNIFFVGQLSQEDMLAYYSRARVHVLPSWFETTGLSSLEAAVMGCSVVITDKGDTREYFEDHAFYCDPGSPVSILEALKKAAREGPSEMLRAKILSQYIWPLAARKTLEVYKAVLDAKRDR